MAVAKRPLVSIVMSAYNGMPELPLAVESILGQTCREWELICVDDGSTDDSLQYLRRVEQRDPRVQVLEQENRGLSPSLHRAIGYARAPLIARMDADDISAPTRIERQVEFMDNHPECVLSGTWAAYFHPVFGIVSVRHPTNDPTALAQELQDGDNPIVHGSAMLRSEAYRVARGYRMPVYEDHDVWLQMMERGMIGVLEKCEYLYRLNPFGLSRKNVLCREALVALCLQLASERRCGGQEVTDYRLAAQEIQRRFPPPSIQRAKQLERYGTAIVHLQAGYRTRAAWAFLGSLGPNILGAKALTRLCYSVVLGRGVPDSGLTDLIGRSLIQNLAWTQPWLEHMGLPARLYHRRITECIPR